MRSRRDGTLLRALGSADFPYLSAPGDILAEGLSGGRSLTIERAPGELVSPWSQPTSPRRQDTDARGFLRQCLIGT